MSDPGDNTTQQQGGALARFLVPRLSIDLRSLAAMRIALGLLILADLLLRSRDLVAHYTDGGVTTGAFLIENYGSATYLSLYYWAGFSPALTTALFVIHGLFALGLIVGFRSRWMALACWFLGASLLKRSPGLYTAGDATVMFLLFWSLFLPIGAKYSVDAAMDPREEEPENSYFSIATIAIILQVCFTYWFAAGMKLSSSMWIDGSAVENALNRDWVVAPLGIWLRQHEAILPALSYGSLAVELLAPFLIFLPRFLCAGRLLTIAIFTSMHIGFALCFHFGIFQWQSLAAWIVIIPACFWDRIGPALLERPSRRVTCYYDGKCHFCKKVLWILRELVMLPRSVVHQAQDNPAIHDEMRKKNSWVVIDHTGTHRHRWDALCYILRRHPLTWVLGALLGLPLIRTIGDRLYRWIANHRNFNGWLIVWLRWRPVRLAPSLTGSVIAFWIIAYIFALNVRTLRPEFGAVIPGIVAFPARVLQIAPNWAMFTTPNALDGWTLLPAQLSDGTEVDLLTGEPLTWEKPALLSNRYGSMRWMKLNQAYAGSQDPNTVARWAPFAEHFAREWDKAHPPEKHVERVVVRYVQDSVVDDNAEPFFWADVDRRNRDD